MSIVITGGAGFIGRHITEFYTNLGEEVHIIDSLATSSPGGLPSSVNFRKMDVRDPKLPEVIEGIAPSLIVHAAAQASVPRSMKDPEYDRGVNVGGTERVIEGALRVDGCRIVFLSTGGAIYGETPFAATEQTLPQPKSFYGAHKYLAEKCLEFAGISFGVARLANVYGPGQRSDLEGGVMAIFAEHLQNHQSIEVYGDGEQSRDFVHVTDVAEAIAAIANSEINDVWNVGSNSEITVTDLVAQMQSIFDTDVPVKYSSPRIGDVRKSCLSVDHIQETLGWSPRIGLEDGIRSLRSTGIDVQG